MMTFSDLVTDIVDRIPTSAGGPDDGLALGVTSIEITLPIEARITDDGALVASAPRGRMATGFAIPHAHLRARFDVRGG